MKLVSACRLLIRRGTDRLPQVGGDSCSEFRGFECVGVLDHRGEEGTKLEFKALIHLSITCPSPVHHLYRELSVVTQ